MRARTSSLMGVGALAGAFSQDSGRQIVGMFSDPRREIVVVRVIHEIVECELRSQLLDVLKTPSALARASSYSVRLGKACAGAALNMPLTDMDSDGDSLMAVIPSPVGLPIERL